MQPQSIPQIFRSRAAEKPGTPALIDGSTGEVTTRGGLLKATDLNIELLRRNKLIAGDLLAVRLPNGVAFVATILAALELHLPVVLIDRDAKQTEIDTVVRRFRVRALITPDPDHGAASTIDVFPRDEHSIQIPPAVALIKLTSGSTGQPKGILTTEANLISDSTSICRSMDIRPTDINLGAIPFSHSYGFSNLVTPLLLQGTAVVVSNEYLPLSMIQLANDFHCTVLPGIPMIYDHLSQLPGDDGRFRTVRTFISAGAPLSPSVSRRFRDRFGSPIHPFYGCSECGGITYDRIGGAAERGTVGTPMSGVTIYFQDERIRVESEAVASGYHCDEADEGKFSPGQFLTDDLGEVTPNREIELIGRVGDLINTAGKKVNPREIENVLLQMKGIRQAKVFGESAGARGEVVAAAIVADRNVSRQRIREHCRRNLSSHKVPRIIKLIDAIPLDERGKIKRAELDRILAGK